MQLEIKGDKYGLQWGTRAFILAEKTLDLSVSQIIIRAGELDVICTLTYCALQNWYELQDSTNVLPFSYDDFLIWIDEQPQGTADSIEEDFLASMWQGKSMNDRYNAISEMISVGNISPAVPVKKKK